MRQVFDVFDQETMLGDRNGKTDGVHFLEGIGAQQFKGDVTGDGNDRDGVGVGGSQTCDEVGGAWAGGGNADTHFTTGAGIAVGGMAGPLFVGGQDMVNPVAVFI